jgi:hypothetical protein
MRLLRLVAPGDFAVDLHPYVTVLAGCTAEQRTALLAAFQAAVQGRTAGLGGLIEVHDVLLDLDEATLALLELDGVSVDVVVEPGDLPGANTVDAGRIEREATDRAAGLEQALADRRARSVEAEEAVAAARAVLDERRADLAGAETTPGPAEDPELERLEAGVAAAEDALATAVDAVTLAGEELEQAEQLLQEAQADTPGADEDGDAAAALGARRAELERALDPEAAADFGVALAELQRLEAAAPEQDGDITSERSVVPTAEPDPDPEPVPADVEARIAEIQGALALHDSFEARRVSEALDALRLTPAGGELVPSPEAIALIDQLRQLDRRISVLSEQVDDDAPDASEILRLQGAVDEVRNAIREAEQATAPSTVADDVAELEAAHSEVVEAREALEVRFGRARAQQRYDAAVAAEEAVLDRLGVRSYTDFMTGGRAALYANTEPEELRELRARERELELELRDLQRRRERAAELASVEDERRTAQHRAQELLEDDVPDEDLAHALFALRVPAERATPYDDLVGALEAVGLPVRDLDVGVEDLEALAAEWLEEYERADGRRPVLEAELAALQQQEEPGGSFGGAVPLPAADAPSSDGGEAGEPLPDLAAAHAAVRAAQERMIAHESALRDLAEIDVRIEELEGDERQRDVARERIADAARNVDEARARVETAVRERERAEQAVVEARTAAEQRREHPPAANGELEAAVANAEQRLAEAEDAADAARREIESAEAALDAAMQELDAPGAGGDQPELDAPVEEVEWYLLARLAGQRQVSFAGSVPLVLDDALASVDDEGLVHLLDRLERMAGAVQVVHLTDDERVHRWAESLGPDRAAVVLPGPADDEVVSAG